MRSDRRAVVAVLMAVVLAAVSALAGCGDDSDDGGSGGDGGGNATLRAGYVLTAGSLPVWVAQDEGFFADHGVKMKITPIVNLAAVFGAVGKQYDFAPATVPDAVKARDSGLDLSLTVGLTVENSERPNLDFLVGKDSGIRDAKDLEGKRIGTLAFGGNIFPAAKYWIKKSGADPEKVNFVELPGPEQADQLAAGRVDGVLTVEPFRGLMLKAGARRLVDPITEVKDPTMALGWISSRGWALEHRDQIADVAAALDDAMAFIKSDEAKARQILGKYLKLPPQAVANAPLPDYRTALSPEDVSAWAAALDEIGDLRKGADAVKPEEAMLTGSG